MRLHRKWLTESWTLFLLLWHGSLWLKRCWRRQTCPAFHAHPQLFPKEFIGICSSLDIVTSPVLFCEQMLVVSNHYATLIAVFVFMCLPSNRLSWENAPFVYAATVSNGRVFYSSISCLWLLRQTASVTPEMFLDGLSRNNTSNICPNRKVLFRTSNQNLSLALCACIPVLLP